MRICLKYALGDGSPAQTLDGIWPSTWAALDYAAQLGAVVATARKVGAACPPVA